MESCGPERARTFVDLAAEALLLLAQRVEFLVGLAEFLGKQSQFLPAVVGQDVEHFLHVLQDSLLIGRRQPQPVVADLAARGGHIRGNRQSPGLRHGVGQGSGRQRLALPSAAAVCSISCSSRVSRRASSS